MEKEELYQLSFQLVLHSGNARSFAMEALQEAKKKDFDGARQKIAEAESELLQAHKFQTQLIHAEAGGENFDIPIILIHAQDHLMTAMTLKDLAVEMIEMREEFLGANTIKEETVE
ncbi:PTS lactose/cellobiose transporter subunit IIA [Peribacillus sp. NPDC097675]|uniref:PTS lactose/cellobiose transporter subunit IIA n=1 Tax=Peribacillus sp. NPDC097675 TaxID=3390618 RepID=UPI003D05D437